MAKVLDEATLWEIAEQAMTDWDLCVVQLQLISISENTVYRVNTDAGTSYVLRIHRSGYHNLAELNSEQQWTAALKRAGIGAPVPLMTRDGRGYATVSVPGTSETRHVGIVEWIDGMTLSSIMEKVSDQQTLALHFDRLGRIAARIHNQVVHWQLPEEFRRHAFDEDGLMGDTPFWGPFWELPELTDAERKKILNARHAIYRALSNYDKGQGTYSLIHGDLHPRNLLVNGNQLSVIDFDDAGFGWHLYELAVALFSYQSHPHFDTIREALIIGYRSERAISDKDLERLPLFLLIRALVSLGWIHQRPEHYSNERLRGLIELACDQMEGLERYQPSLFRN